MDFTVLTDLQTGMEEFSRGMSELGDRNLSPDGGLCFSIDFLQPQGPPEVPPPLTTVPAARGASRSPPAKHAGPEEVRTEVKRPEGQVRSPLLSSELFRKTGAAIFGPLKIHKKKRFSFISGHRGHKRSAANDFPQTTASEAASV